MKITMKQAARVMTTKGLKGIGTLLHSVVVLIVFWIAIDLVQHHIVAEPQHAGMMATALSTGISNSNPRDYGYFTHPQQTALQPTALTDPFDVGMVPVVTPTPRRVAQVVTPNGCTVAQVVTPKTPTMVKVQSKPQRSTAEYKDSRAYMRVEAKAVQPANCKSVGWAPWCRGSQSL